MKLLGCVFIVVLAACATDVAYEKNDGAPDLPERPSSCHVDVMELGRALEHQHPYKITGTLVWEVSRNTLQTLGGEGVRRKIVQAACKNGLFVVTDITAYPNTQNGGATYEAKGGVLVDENGRPITMAVDPKPDAGP